MTIAQNSQLFCEYIGAQSHFILAFAIDYTTSASLADGQFNVFWDSTSLSPFAFSSIRQSNGNVKVALILGGDTVTDSQTCFSPSSIDSWVNNVVSSLTSIIQDYNLDSIDNDYEHFQFDVDAFAECIGQSLTTLENNRVISIASIAPFDDAQVQSHHQALWARFSNVIDHVNFQFYANVMRVQSFLSNKILLVQYQTK
ncbi:chitinase 2-like [Musa acuminata AAA Group]|uniref:chitinase 2-like n=1 Tax=Musa acuminata AAA Group TaxID=214697 RepID=UPI0031D4ACC1